MSGLQQIGVIIAATGLITAMVLPGRQTAAVTSSFFNGLTNWTKVAQGR